MVQPIVIRFKKRISSKTVSGVIASLVLNSIIETVKENDFNVFLNVMTCLEELSKPTFEIEQPIR